MTDDRDLGYLPGRSEYRRIVIALFAAGVATFALLYSTQALLPDFSKQFGVSAGTSTLSLSLTTLGLAVTLLVAGPVSDAIGRTRLIHASLAASVLVAAACALAPNWPILLALRLLLGITLAGLPAVATAYLREELHTSTHARAAGLYIGGTALGGMTGRLLSGAVDEFSSWRYALGTSAILGFACTVTVFVLLPRSRNFVPVSAAPGDVLRMARRALSDRALIALYGIGACSMGALVAVFNTLGYRLERGPFDLGLGTASLVFLVYPLGSVSSVLFGRLADTKGRRAAVLPGCAVMALGILLTLPAWLPTVILGIALLTVGFFAVHGIASGWVPARAHARGVSTAQAASLYLFAYYLGSTVFGSLAGQAWTAGGWALVVLLTTVLAVVVSGLALLLKATPTLLPVMAIPEP